MRIVDIWNSVTPKRIFLKGDSYPIEAALARLEKDVIRQSGLTQFDEERESVGPTETICSAKFNFSFFGDEETLKYVIKSIKDEITPSMLREIKFSAEKGYHKISELLVVLCPKPEVLKSGFILSFRLGNLAKAYALRTPNTPFVAYDEDFNPIKAKTVRVFQNIEMQGYENAYAPSESRPLTETGLPLHRRGAIPEGNGKNVFVQDYVNGPIQMDVDGKFYECLGANEFKTEEECQEWISAGKEKLPVKKPEAYSPATSPIQWEIPTKRREISHWSRYFYENEPKISAAIQIYSALATEGFNVQSDTLKTYFDRINKKLELQHWLGLMSKEYFIIGDVFPFAEIECPECKNSGINQEGKACNHPGGSFRRVVCLNPDWIEVETNILADEPVIKIVSDDDLKRIAFYKRPKEIYDRLPKNVINLILAEKPIPLANESISHLKHNPYPYGTYGTSLIKPLFKLMVHKDKLMIAEYSSRPANGESKLQSTEDYKRINREIKESLFYVEAMIQRISTWRLEMARWLENKIYLPISQMQGFVDKEMTKEVGEPVWIVPKVGWKELDRDQIRKMVDSLFPKEES